MARIKALAQVALANHEAKGRDQERAEGQASRHLSLLINLAVALATVVATVAAVVSLVMHRQDRRRLASLERQVVET